MWHAITAGDAPRVLGALAALPNGWLTREGEGAIALARAKGHAALAERLRDELTRTLANDRQAAALDAEYRAGLDQARRAAAATSSFLGSAAPLAGEGLGPDGRAGRAVGVDPLRRMMRDGSECGSERSSRASSAGSSSRSGRSRHSRRSRRSRHSSRSGLGGSTKKARRRHRMTAADGEDDDDDGSTVRDDGSESGGSVAPTDDDDDDDDDDGVRACAPPRAQALPTQPPAHSTTHPPSHPPAHTHTRPHTRPPAHPPTARSTARGVASGVGRLG